MSKKKKVSNNEPHLFIDAVEKIAREMLDDHPTLCVWSGKMDHERDTWITRPVRTVCVGISGNKNSKNTYPDIVLLTAYLNHSGSAEINFDNGDGEGGFSSESVPFGGGWVPVNVFKEYVQHVFDEFQDF